MKRIVLLLLILSFALISEAKTAYNVDESTHKKYVAELESKDWLYGCRPPNWSVTKPSRGGLEWAAFENRPDIVELQLKAGLDPNSCKSAGAMAIYSKSPKSLALLLEAGLDPNKKYYGNTQLNYAIKKQNATCVGLLLNAGAELDGKTLDLVKKSKNPSIIYLFNQLSRKP